MPRRTGQPVEPSANPASGFPRPLHDLGRFVFCHDSLSPKKQLILTELVTELVSRHVVVACYQLLSDLPTTCKSRFGRKNAL